MGFFKPRTQKKYFANREVHSSLFIPYKCHWDKNTILTKKNELLQVVKISGFSFETADDEDIDAKKQLRNLLYKNLASGNITIYFHTVRKKRPLEFANSSYKPDPTADVPEDFVTYLNNEWKKKYQDKESYFNELYLTILYKADTAGVAILQHLYNKLRHVTDNSEWEASMKEMSTSIYEMSLRVTSTFKDYDARLLSVVDTEDGSYCEILEFLGGLINCGNFYPTLIPHGNLDEYLPNHRLFFGYKSMEASSSKGKRYAAIVTIQEYGPFSTACLFDRFLQFQFEFIVSQSFSFANRTIAIQSMQLQQNRMIQSEDKAVSQIEEINIALDMAMSGDIAFGLHHFSMLCIADDLKQLENILSEASVEIANCGMRSVRETINLEPSYWGQLPGNIDFIVRRSTINTLNLSGFASMHNYPIGKIESNHWGEFVTILETTSGTPYFFNFHVRDVGHSLIIGPTGAGKTVLMNFLCAQAQKFKCRTFFFDKDRGAEIFIRSLGGVHTVIDPGKNCGFNPLKLPDTGENRAFLLDWLTLLVTINEPNISSDDVKLLSQAIDGNYKLDYKDRKLSNIVPFLGIEGTGTLASRIAKWHSKGSHARIFDNDEDLIDLDHSRVFGFEMAELLKDKICLPSVLLYIFHRINISLDGSPTMIVLDEAWALIDNPYFAPRVKDWLKVLRKLNAFVIFATQSPEDAAKSEISDTLIQQTATQIFLPNLKATETYRTNFMLSQREYEIIKTTDPSSRYFVVKQGVNSVVARIDLTGMKDIINVLSGRTDTVLLLNKIRAEVGDDPKKWLKVFYKEAEAIT
ncbi:MAG: VirB4 family type IV secretion/conjugal transfer ATPase [Rickettsiaceae bacterium]|nr:VirB4 family type IV secretion/conjugal transfer ATPase [Rickettsiaceae bacterium]